jgi:hypothetical protein
MRTNHAGHHWHSLRALLGITCMLFATPALYCVFVGTSDRVFGNVLQTHIGVRIGFAVFFLSLFGLGLGLLIYGLRHGTRPPSLLYRLTHPRLPQRTFSRGRA